MTIGGLLILLWAGGALALVSWALGDRAAVVALAGSLRMDPDR